MIATGFSQGSEPKPELARQAVQQALDKLGATVANSVLLFLTPPFTRNLQPTLRAVAGVANCTHVVGCIATGVFTETGATFKTPAVAALVLTGTASLQHQPSDLMLSLATPEALTTAWIAAGFERFGGVARGSVWRNGKGVSVAACEVALQGLSGAVGITHGIEVLSAPQAITATQGHEVVFIGGKPALSTLQQVFDNESLDIGALSFNRVHACLAETHKAALHGQYQIVSLVGANVANRSVMLAQAAHAGQWLCWARSTEIEDCAKTTEALLTQLPRPPDVGLLFSCLGRGSGFNAQNRDLLYLRERFPAMCLIGIEADAALAPWQGRNQMLQQAAVLGLFHA